MYEERLEGYHHLLWQSGFWEPHPKCPTYCSLLASIYIISLGQSWVCKRKEYTNLLVFINFPVGSDRWVCLIMLILWVKLSKVDVVSVSYGPDLRSSDPCQPERALLGSKMFFQQKAVVFSMAAQHTHCYEDLLKFSPQPHPLLFNYISPFLIVFPLLNLDFGFIIWKESHPLPHGSAHVLRCIVLKSSSSMNWLSDCILFHYLQKLFEDWNLRVLNKLIKIKNLLIYQK